MSLESSPQVVEIEPQEAVTVRGDVPVADLTEFFSHAFGEAATAASIAGVDIVGPPFALYPEMPTTTVAVEAGFPVSAPVGTNGDAHRTVLPGGRVVQAVHVGPYDSLEQSYAELQSWMVDHGLRPADAMWECYLTDPESEPDPATWRTMIVCPATA